MKALEGLTFSGSQILPGTYKLEFKGTSSTSLLAEVEISSNMFRALANLLLALCSASNCLWSSCNSSSFWDFKLFNCSSDKCIGFISLSLGLLPEAITVDIAIEVLMRDHQFLASESCNCYGWSNRISTLPNSKDAPSAYRILCGWQTILHELWVHRLCMISDLHMVFTVQLLQSFVSIVCYPKDNIIVGLKICLLAITVPFIGYWDERQTKLGGSLLSPYCCFIPHNKSKFKFDYSNFLSMGMLACSSSWFYSPNMTHSLREDRIYMRWICKEIDQIRPPLLHVM